MNLAERRAGRPKARDLIMRVLYEAERTGDDPLDVLALSFGRFRFTEDGRNYGERIAGEYARHHRRIDHLIARHLARWSLARIGAVERAILRVASAELVYLRDTPARVILDEAVRLAHRYGDPDSASFINGVLDPIAREARRQEMRTECGPERPLDGSGSVC
jgi:N utilization substance protein B